MLPAVAESATWQSVTNGTVDRFSISAVDGRKSMGKRGPKPQPTVLKLARGNPGCRKLNDAEPKPKAEKIEPPKYLTGESLKCWKVITPGLIATGVMTEADVPTLARYCTMHEQWLRYLAEVRAGNDILVILNDDGSVKYQQSSPAATMQQKLATSMLRIEQEFGLTPSARTGIVAQKNDEAEDPLARFLG
jgi:P27 family predicted phage terminase small subunit